MEVLVEKALKACIAKKSQELIIGGGVIANGALRGQLLKRAGALGINVRFPEFAFCQDNAAMVAGWGYQLYKKGLRSNLNLEVAPNLKI